MFFVSSPIENLSLRCSIVPDMVVVGSLKMLKSHKIIIKKSLNLGQKSHKVINKVWALTLGGLHITLGVLYLCMCLYCQCSSPCVCCLSLCVYDIKSEY